MDAESSLLGKDVDQRPDRMEPLSPAPGSDGAYGAHVSATGDSGENRPGACRPGLPLVSRRRLRDEIANWDRERLGAVRIPGDVALTDPSQYEWDLGLSGPDIQGGVEALLHDMIGVTVTMIASERRGVKFTCTDDGESTPRAWGGAPGLAILHDVSLTWLRLDFAISGMLHPRLRQAAGDLGLCPRPSRQRLPSH